MSDPKLKLTDARRRALACLGLHGYVRRSNETDLVRGYVYWQTADWLAEHELGVYVAARGETVLALTPGGGKLARALGLMEAE